MVDSKQQEDLIESLSPLERKIIPLLNHGFEAIKEKAELDSTSVLRGLRFLESKGILKVHIEDKDIADLGVNGIYYKKHHLPERRLIIALEDGPLSLDEAQKKAKLSENEIKVSIGILKQKNIANFQNGKLAIKSSKEELIIKSPEERLIDLLPTPLEKLTNEQKSIFEQLKKRKDIVIVEKQQKISFTLTELGKSLSGIDVKSDLIEEITSEVIRDWTRQKKFRRYDILAPVPKIYPGKKHFVNQAIQYAKRVWTDMGFEEMSGSLLQSSFWNFDALFTPQNHPGRELQDTFYIKDTVAELPDKKIVSAVKSAHEKGVVGSKGWGGVWTEKDAKRLVLRTHTTALSAHQLSLLANLKNKKGKFFAVGKCFRNETVDWSHGFEFNQTEGIVIDKNANFRHLIGYLKMFYEKMGFKKIKFVPAYFPYTEPSMEIYAYHNERKKWIELGGAGILRPEVVIPLLGEYVPVLAWGPGFDRMIMDYYEIKDLREMYQNDIKTLRQMRFWTK